METKYNQNEQQNNNNVKLEEIIDNNYKESFVIPNNNIQKNENKINEDNNVKNREEMKGNILNELNNNNGNELVTVDDMINKKIFKEKKQENKLIQKNKLEDYEYNYFLDIFLFIQEFLLNRFLIYIL